MLSFRSQRAKTHLTPYITARFESASGIFFKYYVTALTTMGTSCPSVASFSRKNRASITLTGYDERNDFGTFVYGTLQNTPLHASAQLKNVL
jgi:hypothetical protein